MRTKLLTILGTLLMAWGVSNIDGQTVNGPALQGGSAQQAIREVEQRWLDSLFRSDAAALESTESADFTLITPSITFNRQGHLRSIRDQASHGAPASSQAAFVVSSQSIKIYGDVTVVSDICSVMGDDAVITPGRYWQTEVWHKEGANWKIVHMHISMLKHGM
jgi:ketosteroid isomerase-like protein